jgi:hypothetical protein
MFTPAQKPRGLAKIIFIKGVPAEFDFQNQSDFIIIGRGKVG